MKKRVAWNPASRRPAVSRKVQIRFQTKLLETATQNARIAAAMWWKSSASVSTVKTVRLTT